MLSDRERLRQKRKNRRNSQRYDAAHRMTRAMFEPFVVAGLADCTRCGEPIEPGSDWDLGHDDLYPHLHSGPEHASCNRGAPHRNKTSRRW